MASATKANPLAFPSAKTHHISNISIFPDTAALVTAVASATAVVNVQIDPTGITAQAVRVHHVSVKRDPEARTTNPATAYRDSEAAAIQWAQTQRIGPSAILLI